jgi:hypothetical protein
MTRLRMRVIETKVVDLRRGKIQTKMTRLRMRVFKMDNNITKINNKITGMARLGKNIWLKVKGNDCGKRSGLERRVTGTRKRTRWVITNPTEKKKTQQRRSINEERKRRKGRRSHQVVFEFTFYTDPVLNVEMEVEHIVWWQYMLTLTILIVIDISIRESDVR